MHNRAHVATAAAVIAVCLWASGSASMNYPLYAQAWGLEPWVTTLMFALYPIALVLVMLLAGDLSDHIGRRASILIGLTVVAGGVILMSIAPNEGTVLAARFVLGVGVGLSLSPATAALVEFAGPAGGRFTGPLTSIAMAVGLVVSFVLGGALIEFAPDPLHLNQWALLPAVLVVLWASARLPRHLNDEDGHRWRIRSPYAPSTGRLVFAGALSSLAAGFAIAAIYIGLAADIIGALIGQSNSFVNAIAIAFSAAAVGVTAALFRGLRPRTSLLAGFASAIVGMVSLVACGSIPSLPLFILSGMAAGASNALLASAGISLIALQAPAHHRAGALSTGYIAAYVSQAGTAVGLGFVATVAGFTAAVTIGLVVVLTLAALALALVMVGQRSTEH